MSEANAQPTSSQLVPEGPAREIRRLVHDLSNALEIIVQTNYLLGMAALDENGRQWQKMLDQGVQQASSLNLQLREYIRAHS